MDLDTDDSPRAEIEARMKAGLKRAMSGKGKPPSDDVRRPTALGKKTEAAN